jgi:hypothetical protein
METIRQNFIGVGVKQAIPDNLINKFCYLKTTFARIWQIVQKIHLKRQRVYTSLSDGLICTISPQHRAEQAK